MTHYNDPAGNFKISPYRIYAILRPETEIFRHALEDYKRNLNNQQHEAIGLNWLSLVIIDLTKYENTAIPEMQSKLYRDFMNQERSGVPYDIISRSYPTDPKLCEEVLVAHYTSSNNVHDILSILDSFVEEKKSQIGSAVFNRFKSMINAGTLSNIETLRFKDLLRKINRVNGYREDDINHTYDTLREITKGYPTPEKIRQLLQFINNASNDVDRYFNAYADLNVSDSIMFQFLINGGYYGTPYVKFERQADNYKIILHTALANDYEPKFRMNQSKILYILMLLYPGRMFVYEDFVFDIESLKPEQKELLQAIVAIYLLVYPRWQQNKDGNAPIENALDVSLGFHDSKRWNNINTSFTNAFEKFERNEIEPLSVQPWVKQSRKERWITLSEEQIIKGEFVNEYNKKLQEIQLMWDSVISRYIERKRV